MREHQAETLSPQETEDRIWDYASDISVCMFTTWTGTEQNSRPLWAHVEREEKALYFLVDEHGHKNEEIARFPQVSCSFVDKGSNNFVVVRGNAELSNDRAKIAELFTNFAKAWWEDENDPAIRLLTVRPTSGEVWDGPSGPIASAKMLFAAATGAEIDMGESGEARL